MPYNKPPQQITIGDLKELLKEFKDSDLVVLSSDSEGNSYSPAFSVMKDARYVHSDRHGNGELADDDRSGVPCLILYPMH